MSNSSVHVFNNLQSHWKYFFFAFLKIAAACFLMIIISCTQKNHSNELVLGTNAAYPPYESINAKGEVEGFDIDVAHAIAKKLNKKLIIKDMSFDALILGLEQNKFDFLLSGLSITAAREKEIAMVPYQGETMKSYVLAFWNHIPANIRTLADFQNLNKKTIAVQTGTIMEEYLRGFPKITSKPLESTSELIMDIKHQKSDAALLEPHIAASVSSQHGELKLLALPLPPANWVKGNGIGIKKQNSVLRQQIEKAVDDLKREGVIRALERKWFKDRTA